MSEEKEPPDDMPRGGERVFYIRDDRGQPVGCVAYQPEGDEVCVGASFLHPNDAWDRALARRIALGRLRVRPIGVVMDPGGPGPLSTALAHLVGRADTPGHIRRTLRAGIQRRATRAALREVRELIG